MSINKMELGSKIILTSNEEITMEDILEIEMYLNESVAEDTFNTKGIALRFHFGDPVKIL